MLQPLDVGFFRQLKIFIRRITEEAIVQHRIEELTSREAIINLMSMIYNQLQAPAYRDLWRYAWRKTDALFSIDELTNHPPANVQSIQFSFDPAAKCKVDGCTENVVIQSAYNRDHFCLTHFLQRKAFVPADNDEAAIGMDVPVGPSSRADNDEDEEIEDESIIVRGHADPIRNRLDELLYDEEL